MKTPPLLLSAALLAASAAAFTSPPPSGRFGPAAAARRRGAAPSSSSSALRASRLDEPAKKGGGRSTGDGDGDGDGDVDVDVDVASEILESASPLNAERTDAVVAAADAAAEEEVGSTDSGSGGGAMGEEEEEGDGWASGLLWRGSIVALCALWASNFAAAKIVMAEPGVDSALYAVSRFGTAGLALLPGSVLAARRGVIDWDTARGAAICGGWVAFGYLGQTLGLLTTTASRSCVICSLHCVFVAALAEWTRVSGIWGKGRDAAFDFARLVPALVAVAGVAIVELRGAGGAPTVGDLLSFAQPIGFGLGYVQLEELMRKRPEAALPVSAIKILVVCLASLAFFELSPVILGSSAGAGAAAAAAGDVPWAALWPPRVPDIGPIVSSETARTGILYTGLITTALALWVESVAFKRVPATDASIILATEPLFAAAAGALLLGETFGTSDYAGACLIIGACVLAILQEDEAADEFCDPYTDDECVPKRTFPFVE